MSIYSHISFSPKCCDHGIEVNLITQYGTGIEKNMQMKVLHKFEELLSLQTNMVQYGADITFDFYYLKKVIINSDDRLLPSESIGTVTEIKLIPSHVRLQR